MPGATPVGGEALILGDVFGPDDLEEIVEHAAAGCLDVDRAVFGRKDAHREGGGMIVARLRRDLTIDQPARRLKVEYRDHRFQQRGLYPLPLARALALNQCRHDSVRQI